MISFPEGFKGSVEFKEGFCTLFDIDDLNDVIEVLIDVNDERSAREVQKFYSCSICLIQQFLIASEYLSKNQSAHFQSFFSEIKFISVDSITVSYRYKDTTRSMATPSVLDSYVDQSKKKFFILRKYEGSPMRHIDTMTNFLIQNEKNRLKVSQYIWNLFKTYQDHGIEYLIQLGENYQESELTKWIIRAPDPLVVIQEKTVEPESVNIPGELIQNVKDQATKSMQKLNEITRHQSDRPSGLTCFPQNARSTASSAVVENDTVHVSSTRESIPTPTTTQSQITTSNRNPTDPKQETNDHEKQSSADQAVAGEILKMLLT